MSSSSFTRWFTLITGGVVAGEAMALLVGMHLLSGSANPWFSFKNDGLLFLDLVTGLGLAVLAILDIQEDWMPVVMVELVLIGLITHAFREWEYLRGVANPFLANTALFIFNNIKLLGLIALAALYLPPFFESLRLLSGRPRIK